MLRSLLPLVVLATVLAGSLAGQAPSWRADLALARAADTDASGDVTTVEWLLFVARVPRDAAGRPDRELLVAHVIAAALDADGDGLTASDVAAALAIGDADGDGTLDAREFAAVVGGRDRLPALAGIVALGADADEDGVVSAAEREALTGDVPDAPVALAAVAEWARLAEAWPSEDVNALDAPTLVLTMRSSLDADWDGLLTADDLTALFAALDENGDLTLSAGELQPRGRGRDSRMARRAEPASGRAPGMPWQRTLDDALALVRATGKPLLVCVNTQGEPASDALAAGRYHDPDFLRLANGFVPVLASPDRRNVRDHDDRGHRIVDPRFGRLTDGEHVDIEPQLFERYFAGTRVAPRHVGVSPDGEILFDLYLLDDLGAIDRALAQYGNFDVALPDPWTMNEDQLFASPDARARERLEAAWPDGSEEDRLRWTQASLRPGRAVTQPEILRLGLRDESPTVRRAALRVLAANAQLAPVELFDVALSVAAEDEVGREELAAALTELAGRLPDEQRTRVRRLSRILHAQSARSSLVDVELWKLALVGAPEADFDARWELDEAQLYDALGRLEERLDEVGGEDARLLTLLADAALRAAEYAIAVGSSEAGLLLGDAESAARRATEAAPDSARAHALLAWARHLQGDVAGAGEAAAAALPGLLDMASDELSARTLVALAVARTSELATALAADTGWPAERLADIIAAYDVLVAHPWATEEMIVTGLDALIALEVYGAQQRILAAALARWPDSVVLHLYNRWQKLRDVGARGLQESYARWTETDGGPTLLWYAGYASLAAAERLREDRRADEALLAYADAVELFERAVELEPSYANAMQYAAQAHAGRARLLLARDELTQAVASVQAAALASPDTFEEPDALGESPASTARAVLRRLRLAEGDERAAELSRFLEDLGLGSSG